MTADPETFRIASDALSVEIARCGAELQRITDTNGRDLLWSGDPAWWLGRAPFLFPIVGALRNAAYRLGDRSYRLPKHGFARVMKFAPLQSDASSLTLRLTATDGRARNIRSNSSSTSLTQ